MPPPAQLVWFKRDLRVADHRPLVEASRRGPCLCVYAYEPEVIGAEDFDACHLEFINQSLAELRANLRELGGELLLRAGRLPDVFAELHREHPFQAIWCHEETGNAVTFDRDKRVIRWCREAGVAYHETYQHGVVRRLKDRDGWARNWDARMGEPLTRRPERVAKVDGVEPGGLRSPESFGLERSTKHDAQHGGEALGREALQSFLTERGRHYRSDMSSPVTGEEGCSRLSPYLAYGCLSLRYVYQATARRAQLLRGKRARGEAVESGWLQSLTAFNGRLHWHCHFMQKLEDEPRIEFENMNRAFDGLRDDGTGGNGTGAVDRATAGRDTVPFNEELFDAWRRGETGYPMVDACMRALHQTGWINFRMRAMLVSFACYHLWLHWRRPAVYLARQFVDYEPGIHYSQLQMQAGTTGINSVRIYSPIKQVEDQDPHGVFIRRYVPELVDVPNEHLAEPHKMPPILQQDTGCVVGCDYPLPIVPHAAAYNEAKRRMFAHRKRLSVQREAHRVMQKHGSRRKSRWR